MVSLEIAKNNEHDALSENNILEAVTYRRVSY